MYKYQSDNGNNPSYQQSINYNDVRFFQEAISGINIKRINKLSEIVEQLREIIHNSKKVG